MTFELTPEQVEKFNKWKEKWDEEDRLKMVAIGGAYTFHFNPTGIGTFITVSRVGKKEELDLNDYDSF